jgi:hypothetical protein
MNSLAGALVPLVLQSAFVLIRASSNK